MNRVGYSGLFPKGIKSAATEHPSSSGGTKARNNNRAYDTTYQGVLAQMLDILLLSVSKPSKG